MKLETIIIQNFRGFSGKTAIRVSWITTFIGRNDAGQKAKKESLTPEISALV